MNLVPLYMLITGTGLLQFAWAQSRLVAMRAVPLKAIRRA